MEGCLAVESGAVLASVGRLCVDRPRLLLPAATVVDTLVRVSAAFEAFEVHALPRGDVVITVAVVGCTVPSYVAVEEKGAVPAAGATEGVGTPSKEPSGGVSLTPTGSVTPDTQVPSGVLLAAGLLTADAVAWSWGKYGGVAIDGALVPPGALGSVTRVRGWFPPSS